jgi:hypothetical protein
MDGGHTKQGQGRKDDQPQGYGAPTTGNQFAKPLQKEEMKTIAMAGTGIINGGGMPTGTPAKAYYGGGYE